MKNIKEVIWTSYLIQKFKGTYRLKAPYDLNTKDFPRKLNGNLEDVDVYIDCQFGNKIFHFGRDILQAYIPSLGRGHNILKAIQQTNPSIIFDIEETDSEVLFKFKYVNSDEIIPLLKPKTSGAGISPFSSKNLPKCTYIIPDKDLDMYKQIVAKIPQERILTLTHSTNNFIKLLATKKNPIENIKADMKKKCLKSKEYIHSIGKWNEYINYLHKEDWERMMRYGWCKFFAARKRDRRSHEKMWELSWNLFAWISDKDYSCGYSKSI